MKYIIPNQSMKTVKIYKNGLQHDKISDSQNSFYKFEQEMERQLMIGRIVRENLDIVIPLEWTSVSR